MYQLTEKEVQTVKDQFPGIADFGIGCIWINDDKTLTMTMDCGIPPDCGYDDDCAAMEKFCLGNFGD